MATGCAFFDYDNDGWMDIFILSGQRLENTQPAPPIGSTRTTATAHSQTSPSNRLVDIDGRRRLRWRLQQRRLRDLFLTYYGQNRLYRNNGDGTFTNVTEKAGLLHLKPRFSSGCTFVDYNRDGLLTSSSPTTWRST